MINARYKKVHLLNTIIYIIFVAISIISLYPIIYIIINSMKTQKELASNLLGLPKSLNFANYIVAFNKSDIINNFRTTFTISIVSTIILLIVTILAAFCLTKLDIRFFKHKMNINFYKFFIIGLLVSEHLSITPLLFLLSRLKLSGNIFIVILIFASFSIPFGIFVLYGFFKEIPDELIDAAKIDGANNINVLSNIVLPLSKGAVASVTIVHMLWVWNDFLIPLIFLQGSKYKTLTYGLFLFKQKYQSDWPVIFSYSLMQIIPIFILFIFLQRYFLKGLMAGAIKG